MKKIILNTLTILSIFLISNVKANSINSIDMDIYIDSIGDAYVTEYWEVFTSEDTELYKTYKNLEHMEIEDFTVSMDETEFENITWNINASFEEKKYKSGINYISNGVELCFGITDYGIHTYKLTYKITGFVFNTSDNYQVVYFGLIPKTSLNRGMTKIKIYSDFEYEDTLDVWGYGYKNGYAYVSDGYITLLSDSLNSNEYMTALIKFPSNTFNLQNTKNVSFDEYLEMAEEGAVHYKESIWIIIISFIFTFFPWLIIALVIIQTNKENSLKSGNWILDYGKTGRKIPKDIAYYRDIPCSDIYHAYFITYNYKLMKNKTDFLGAILLKWLKDGKIETKTEVKEGIVKDKTLTKILFKETTFENNLEEQLYEMMYSASKDGILEEKEFEKWCKSNYSKILNWFDKVLDYSNGLLLNEGKLIKSEKKYFFKYKYSVDSSLFLDAKNVAGLKKFLKDFSNIKDRKAIEVTLWEEYLIYAQLFGIAKEVAKEFKEMYPDVIKDYSYDNVVFVNHFSYTGISSARSAYQRASSYSSGGGGFSSSGGGGGSFGGGGSMGSR